MSNTRYPITRSEGTLYECNYCLGKGETVHHDGPLGPLVAVVEWCAACKGAGHREYGDHEDPFDPTVGRKRSR